MARSEDCLHCVDLQAELKQICAHQRTLDAKIKNDVQALEEKHAADVNFLFYRVSSLQTQFDNLSKKCAHIDESIEILKYMMDKLSTPGTSSNNLKNAGNDENPENSIDRQMSHIYIN